jgi:hypothetical protein
MAGCAGAGGGATGAGTGTGTAGGNAGTGDIGTGAGMGGDTAAAGVSRTDIGPPGPGRNPGMPNCKDNTSACSNRETSRPIASRRSDASMDVAGRAAVAFGMLVVLRQEMKT